MRRFRIEPNRFAALASPDFRRLWIGQIISAAGSQMQFAALNWQIYALTGSPLALGGIGLARVIPIIFFSLLGGAVADSRDRRKLLLGTQTVLALVALVLGTLALAGHTTLTAIYLLTAVGAGATAFDNPARQALIPSLVPREQLPSAFALNSTGFQVATIAGPVFAGIIIGLDKTHLGRVLHVPHESGIGIAYLINALSFLAVIVALLFLQFRPTPRAEGEVVAPAVSISALKEGIAFVRGTPILVGAMTLDFFATFFSSATALLPIFAKDILKVGPQGYGWLSAFPAIGSLIAGMLITVLPPIKLQGRVLLWSVVVYGLATIGFGAMGLGFPYAFALSALFLAATGASDTVSTVLRQTIRQTVTPDRLRGRMVSINMIFFMGGPQLGELEAGALAKLTGAAMSVIWGGVGCIATAAVVATRAPWLYHYRLAPDTDKS